MNNYTKTLQVEAIQINFDETIMNESKEIFGQHFSYYTGSVDYETGKAKGYYYINGVHCYNGYYVVKTGSEISVVPTDIFEDNYTKVEVDENYKKALETLHSVGGGEDEPKERVVQELVKEAAKEVLNEKQNDSDEFILEPLENYLDETTNITPYSLKAIYKSGKSIIKEFAWVKEPIKNELFEVAMRKLTKRQINSVNVCFITDIETNVRYEYNSQTCKELIEALGENKDVSASSNDNE